MNAFHKLSRGELDSLEELIQAFAGSLDIDATLQHTVRELMTLMHTEAASLFLVDRSGGELVCQACAGPVDVRGLRIQPGIGIVGRAVQEGRIQLIRDVAQTDSFFGEVDRRTGFTTHSILCAPLMVGGRPLGAIELINRTPSPDNPFGLFGEHDRRQLAILASAAALALHNAHLADELARNRALQRELEIARHIQESFLPEFEEAHPIVGLNLAAHEVSGDFFDYQLLPGGRYAFNIGDVSGKGIDAALLMAKASSLYHCLAKSLASPAAVLDALNGEMCEHATRGMFVTMIGGSYEPATGMVTLANAGHPPAIRRTGRGEYRYHDVRGIPLGIQAGERYEEESFPLAGDSLYLYTDGLSEGLTRGKARPDGDGREGLEAMIERFIDVPRQQRLNLFADEVILHGTRFDDLTILLLEDRTTHATRVKP